MKKLLFILFIALLITGCTNQMYTKPADEMDKDMMKDEMTEDKEMTEVGYIDVTPTEAVELINANKDLVIIDVSPRYAEGHIPRSINYYVGDGSLDRAIPRLDKEVPYLVYCHVDSASIAGAEKLVEAGFDPVYRLEGNYSAWVNAGYDIEK